MSDDQLWNDEARSDLRDRLRETILGELRLAKNEPASILDVCREVHIEEDSPEEEWDEFNQFAATELDRAFSHLASEQSAWPAETDCDRLDRVEATLRDRGILLWQVSPCCDTCTSGELPDRIDAIDERYPGFSARARGYAFFIEQNMPEMLADNTNISVYLGYGWISPTEVAPEVYEKNALAVAHEVCQSLRDAGFAVDWDGDFSRKICVSLNWQRRSILK